MNAYHHLTDLELTALLSQGDNKAFEFIYRVYASGLYRYAKKNISRREDCEEIVQDVFESLWIRHAELGHVTVLSGYLYQMVRYKIIRYFQHEAVKKKYAEHYTMFEAVYDNATEEERRPSFVQAMIEKSLAQLPERCRLAVKLRLTENLSNADIAQRMNIKKTTVENYMVTALSHLRASYQNLISE